MRTLIALVAALIVAAPAQAQTRDGLVAEYLLNETSGTVVHDTSSAARDGTLRQGSDALWGGGALTFTGGAKATGSWVQLPSNLLQGKESATVSTELYADPTMLSSFHFLWNIGSDSNVRYFFASLNCANGRAPLVGVKGASETLVPASSCAATANRWMNVTAVVDGAADNAKLYIDGVQVASGAMPYSPADVTDQSLNAIGRSPWPDTLYKGKVAGFRVYDRALTAAEVTALSNADAAEHAAELQATANALVAGLTDRTVNGDFTLPANVTWTSSNPAVVSTTGDVTQSAQTQTVQLTARASFRGVTAEKTITVTVLPEAAPDDPYGYMLVHFIEDSAGYAEKIYLDVSRDDDPTHWKPLNGGKPILASNLGTTGIRDPYLTYNPETKTYYIIATDLRVFGGDNGGWGAWSSRGSLKLNVWESKDLVSWSSLRQLTVSPPTAGMSWAPEATWVPSLHKFVVYWSSNLYTPADTGHTGASYSRVVYGTTSDFKTDYAYQGVMLDSGANVIDTTIIQNAGTTYRISKDNGGGRGIFMEKTTAADWWLPTTAWTALQRNIGQADYGSVEGPAVFKDHNRDHWYLYVDVIPSTGYRPYETTNLDNGWSKIDIASTGFTMTPSTKHGGVISLTKRQYDEVRTADVATLLTQSVTVSTKAGTAPTLPATADVVLKNGDTAKVPITWDAIDPAKYSKPGTFTVEGRVKSIANNLNEATGLNVPLTSTTAIDNVVTASVVVPASTDIVVGGDVAPTLALTLGAPGVFAPFTPGIDRDYVATTTATVNSSAGDAALTVSDPGRLSNGSFSLAEPLKVEFSKASWTAPAAKDPVTISFKQHIGANEALRTGVYSKTLTFTLSTTTP